MIQRFIHHVRVERPVVTETAAEARERLGARFPRGAVRRMTHLGMLLGSTLDGVELTADDAIVYATTYAETRALEDFLMSFPAASPSLFQTSIHPGGVQQVLIGRQQPVARLWPLAGRARLAEQALLAALLEPAPRVLIAGGEERGTWLLENNLASDRAFAFALLLTRDPGDAVSRVGFEPDGAGFVVPASAGSTPNRPKPGRQASNPDPCPTLPEFADALAERRPLAWRGVNGGWKLAWR